MTEFLRKWKDIRVGRYEVRIFRKGVALVWQLLSIIEKQKQGILEVFVFQRVLHDILKEFFEIRGWGKILFVIRKMNQQEFQTLLDEILKFNLGEVKKQKEEHSYIEIERNLYLIISQIIFYTGWELEYVLSLDFPTIRILYNNIRFFRWNTAMDVAGAWDLKTYKRVLEI